MPKRDVGGRGFGGRGPGGFDGRGPGGFDSRGPGGFGGPSFGPRRVGIPLVPPQVNSGPGGAGLGSSLLSSLGLGGTGVSSSGTSGFGTISPLLTSLVAGGVGYFVGNRTAQNAQPDQSTPPPQPLQATQSTQAAQPVQASYPQASAYTGATTNLSQMPASQTTSGGTASESLSKLQLLGELHQSGVLTDQEFEQQKQRILNS